MNDTLTAGVVVFLARLILCNVYVYVYAAV